jgi:hypothetical protein
MYCHPKNVKLFLNYFCRIALLSVILRLVCNMCALGTVKIEPVLKLQVEVPQNVTYV